MFTNVRWERGLRAKTHKTEHNGLVSGVLCEIAVEGGGGGGWCG
jgi:hypothetical protein